MRRVKVRKFQIYQEFNSIACYDLFFAQHSYWESLRACYDSLVTNGDVSGRYRISITLLGETMILQDDGDWAIALLKWGHVTFER